MLLTVDVGNTETVLGLYDEDRLVRHWRVATLADRTADELAVLFNGLLSQERPMPDVHGVAVCSSVPTVQHELREMLRTYYDVPTVVVGPGVRTGVPILMDNPHEVGADRVVNSVAASHLFGGACVIVDFGTATTFDVVTARGEYAGGAISPGIEISLDALGRRGAQLHRVELVRPRSVVAKNTVEALQSGAVFGFAGQVDGMVERILTEVETPAAEVAVVATGGLAPLVVHECRTVHRYEPWLTLLGLRLVYERNHS